MLSGRWEGLESYLESQDLGLNQVERSAVDLNETTARLYHKFSLAIILPPFSNFKIARSPIFTNLAVGDSGGRLLLAEALHALRCRHDC